MDKMRYNKICKINKKQSLYIEDINKHLKVCKNLNKDVKNA